MDGECVHGLIPGLHPEISRIIFKHAKACFSSTRLVCRNWRGLPFPDRSKVEEYAKTGAVEQLAEYLEGFGTDIPVCNLAALHNDSIPVLEWSTKNGYRRTERATINAAKMGRLDALQWLVKNGYHYDAHACHRAAIGGGNENVAKWVMSGIAKSRPRMKIACDLLVHKPREGGDLRTVVRREMTPDSWFPPQHKQRQSPEMERRALSRNGRLQWDEESCPYIPEIQTSGTPTIFRIRMCEGGIGDPAMLWTSDPSNGSADPNSL